MKASLARQYLMRSMAMKRKNIRQIHDKVREGKCIIENCNNPCVSRGLCDRCRQRWYAALRKLSDDDERCAAEEKAIQLGLLLPVNEQDEIRRRETNPFAKAVG